MNKSIKIPSVELKIKYSADVIVCGGGSAGSAAAVAAARNGAKVLLLEQSGCCGGMVSRGLLPSIIHMTDGKNIVAAGICKEFVDRIAAETTTDVSYSWQNIRPENCKRILDEMLDDAGVKVFFETAVIGVVSENGEIQALDCYSPAGRFAVTGRIFIDATGDGNLAAMAGANFEVGDGKGNFMAPTLCTYFDNIAYANDRTRGIGRNEWCRAAEENRLPVDEGHFVGFFKTGESCGLGNLGHIYNTNVLDVESRSNAFKEGRQLAVKYLKFFQDNVDGFNDAELAMSADMLGIRESRRITGDYVLTEDDYINRRHFSDDIGSFAYPIDIHANNSDAEKQAQVEEKLRSSAYHCGENYGIPYRALLTSNTTNLMTVGRCISSDRAMQASLRVVPGCMISGQAAGTAAALTIKDNCTLRQNDVKKLQKTLHTQGAFINSNYK